MQPIWVEFVDQDFKSLNGFIADDLEAVSHQIDEQIDFAQGSNPAMPPGIHSPKASLVS
jgi:hypothetical protein